MRRPLAAAVALALIGTACLGGGGGDARTVLVDFSHDEFASIMIDFFPSTLEVTPGMTIVFRQTWTGEPHTVTGGTLVDAMMEKGRAWTDFFDAFEALMAKGADLPNPEQPEGSAADLFKAVSAVKDARLRDRLFDAYDALRKQGIELPDRNDPGDASFESLAKTVEEGADAFFEDIGLPYALTDNEQGEFGANQNAGQPCFLDEGLPPTDAGEPCPGARQRQPVFDGTASYYNSGIIPYEGPQGNTFRVQLSEDIKPGTYSFFCSVHGPQQATEVKVRPAGTKVPDQAEVSRRARKEIAKFAGPMLKSYREARDGRIDVDGEAVRAPFAGLSAPVYGAINEFFPKTIRTKVGREVTWKMMGWDHSVSFGVPKYFPIIRFADDGKVSLNPQLYTPAGGSPDIPEQEEGAGTLKVNGGTYDGSGFFSSGLMSAEPYAEYTLRFSKPGTFKYACLLHPPMVGTVVVTR